MSETLYQVIQAAAGNMYVISMNAEVNPDEKRIAPPEGEPGLSMDAAIEICSTPLNTLLATVQMASDLHLDLNQATAVYRIMRQDLTER